MWPMGHAAVAYLCYSLVARVQFDRQPGDGVAVVLLVASSVPDLIDKPLAWYASVLPAGRSLGHSLLVLVPATVLAVAIANHFHRGEYGIAFGVGTLSHATADALPALWQSEATANFLLWPITDLAVPETSPTLLGLLRSSLSDPYFLFELTLLGIAVLVWRSHGYPGMKLLTRYTRADAPVHE